MQGSGQAPNQMVIDTMSAGLTTSFCLETAGRCSTTGADVRTGNIGLVALIDHQMRACETAELSRGLQIS